MLAAVGSGGSGSSMAAAPAAPPKWYVTADELSKVPAYMKGRLTLDKVGPGSMSLQLPCTQPSILIVPALFHRSCQLMLMHIMDISVPAPPAPPTPSWQHSCALVVPVGATAGSPVVQLSSLTALVLRPHSLTLYTRSRLASTQPTQHTVCVLVPSVLCAR